MTATTHSVRTSAKQAKSVSGAKPETRFIKRQAVEGITGLSCTEIYRRIAADNFPKQVVQSPKCVAWVESEVLAWLEARITESRDLAKQLGNKHKSSMALIERYSEKFKELGLLALETEARQVGQHGGGDVRFALLDEDQVFSLLAQSRNTDRIAELKASLIIAFREARHGNACQTLEARKKEASNSGRRLAHWRYDKQDVYAHVANLREQLKLPIDLEDLYP